MYLQQEHQQCSRGIQETSLNQPAVNTNSTKAAVEQSSGIFCIKVNIIYRLPCVSDGDKNWPDFNSRNLHSTKMFQSWVLQRPWPNQMYSNFFHMSLTSQILDYFYPKYLGGFSNKYSNLIMTVNLITDS